MLEFYDFLTYSFFAIQIGHTFFPTQSEYGSLMLSLATFGAGFVTRPIGGIVIGAYADRVGRRPAMLLCFVLMGVAIVALALTPSYQPSASPRRSSSSSRAWCRASRWAARSGRPRPI